MKDILKIMICCHKPAIVPHNNIYLPIQVGRKLSSYDLQMQTDDKCQGIECDNISAQNNIYCEMTAMYWAWKNIRKIYPNLQYVGLCHYRRYFIKPLDDEAKEEIYKNFINENLEKIGIENNYGIKLEWFTKNVLSVNSDEITGFSSYILKNLNQYDLFAPHPIRYFDVRVQDGFTIPGKFINLLVEIVERKYPEYYQSLIQVLNGNRLYNANMLILRIQILDEYASFVFSVLNDHLYLVKSLGYCIDPLHEKVYSRMSGYLSELLTSAFIEKKKKSCRFLELGRAKVFDINDTICKFCTEGQGKLYIYGAGNIGTKVAQMFKETNIRFNGFIETNRTKKEYMNHPVFPVIDIPIDSYILLCLGKKALSEVKKFATKRFAHCFDIVKELK